jgi:hypothetical protein
MDRGRGGRDGGRDNGRGGGDGRDSRGPRRGPGGPGGPGGGGFGGGFGGPPPFRERRPAPPPPPPDDADFEEVDTDLAVAILDTAARLTEVVGASGLPEGYVERREAVLETFEAVYYRVLETVTGGADEDEEDDE